MLCGSHRISTPTLMNIYANGNSEMAKVATHIAVIVCLMQGEFDDQLKWPFRGKIAVKLVNQDKNKDHVVKTI